MVVKNLWVMLVVCVLAIGCTGSPFRDCLDNTEGMGKVQCGTMVIPVLAPVLPSDE